MKKKKHEIPEYDVYKCWRDSDGIHFTYEPGWSDCGHTISRGRIKEFFELIKFPAKGDWHAFLNGMTYQEWKHLHTVIHDFADDNSVWIGTDELEKWGESFSNPSDL
jgi:hypothetical protein